MSWIIMSEIYLSGVYIYIYWLNLLCVVIVCDRSKIILYCHWEYHQRNKGSQARSSKMVHGRCMIKNKRAKKIYKYIFASVFVIPVFVVRCIGDERKKKEKKKGREKKISIIIIITQAFEVTNMECSLFSCVVCAFISIAITHSSIVNTTISSNTVDYLTSFLFLFNT